MDRVWVEDEVDNIILEHAGMRNDELTRRSVYNSVHGAMRALYILGELRTFNVVCDYGNNHDAGDYNVVVDVYYTPATGGEPVRVTVRGDI